MKNLTKVGKQPASGKLTQFSPLSTAFPTVILYMHGLTKKVRDTVLNTFLYQTSKENVSSLMVYRGLKIEGKILFL